MYGVDRFGASAPVGDLADAFGFTAEKLGERVQAHLRTLLESERPVLGRGRHQFGITAGIHGSADNRYLDTELIGQSGP